MKNVLMKKMFFVFVMISVLGTKSYVNAEVVRNLTGESIDGWVYDYKYWNGSTWSYRANKSYTNYPIDITYDVIYCYGEAYKMTELVNEQRRKAGVPELQAKDELMDVAMMRAAETAVYWSHTRPDGSSIYSASIYIYGENLYTGSSLAVDANRRLVNSCGHYATMIDDKVGYAGFGCVKVDDTYYWVQIFSYPNIYYEDGYFGKDSKENRPVQWDKMTLGNRKDYTAPFTAKVNPKLITLKSTHDKEWDGEGLYDEELHVGEATWEKIYAYYFSQAGKGNFGDEDWTCEVKLSSDQYDAKVLTPDLCSYQDGKIRALILPYFGKMKINGIGTKEIIAWQNELLAYRDEKRNPYSQMYLKTVHSQLSAIFNHAVRYYDLRSNPVAKAGNMGSEEHKEMLFWTKEEYRKFADEMMDKPVSFYAFEMLYWCGIREGDNMVLIN